MNDPVMLMVLILAIVVIVLAAIGRTGQAMAVALIAAMVLLLRFAGWI